MPSVGYVWLRGTSGFKARRRHPRSVTVIPWTDVVVVAPLGENDRTARISTIVNPWVRTSENLSFLLDRTRIGSIQNS